MNADIDQLIADHLAGRLDMDGKARLAQWLDADPKARGLFVCMVEEQADLVECLGSMRTESAAFRESSAIRRVRPAQRNHWLPLAAAAVVMLGMLAALWSVVNESQATQRGVARVTAVQESEEHWLVGDIVPQGFLELKSGKLELQFHSGSRMVLEGNCRMEIVRERQCSLNFGRLTIHVPVFDSSFAVAAPGIQVVDVGTAFGLESDGTVTELHVLRGSVLATAQGAALGKYLSESAAVRAVAGTETGLEPVPFDPKRFARPVTPASDGKAWLHYSFDEPDGVEVADKGTGLPEGPFNAKIENGEASTLRVPGRFGRALALDGHGMELISNCPGVGGDHPRSLAMWLRLPPVETGMEDAQALAAWGEAGKNGAHWLVGTTRLREKVFFRTEITGGRMQGNTPLNDGQWHHVVSVYFGGNASNPADRMHHYIDGRLEATQFAGEQVINTVIDSEKSVPLTLGRHPYHRGSTTQALIDEFYLFDRALTPAEIQSLYSDNRLNASPRASK